MYERISHRMGNYDSRTHYILYTWMCCSRERRRMYKTTKIVEQNEKLQQGRINGNLLFEFHSLTIWIEKEMRVYSVLCCVLRCGALCLTCMSLPFFLLLIESLYYTWKCGSFSVTYDSILLSLTLFATTMVYHRQKSMQFEFCSE